MTTPTFVAKTATTYAARSNTVVTKPAGTVNDDYVVLTLFQVGPASSYPTLATGPSGFTHLDTRDFDDGTNYRRCSVWGKVAASEGTSWSFTHASMYTEGSAVAYRNVDTTTPQDVAAAGATGIVATVTWPSLTTVTDGAKLVAAEWDWSDYTTNGTPSTGWAERVETGNTYVQDYTKATAGAVGTFSHTSHSSTETWLVWAASVIALRPAGTTPPPPPPPPPPTGQVTGSLSANASNASGVAGSQFATTYTATATPGTGVIVLSGFGAQAGIGAAQPASVDSVSVTLSNHVGATAPWGALTAGLYDGATLIGAAQAITKSTTTTNSQTFTFTGITWANLSNLAVRLILPNTAAGIFYLTAAPVVVAYTLAGSGGNAAGAGRVVAVSAVAGSGHVQTPPPPPDYVTAAQTFGWGTPIAGSEFTDGAFLTNDPDWAAWDGVGYEGNGVQSPDQISVVNGILRIAGTSDGATGALAYFGATQRYGRWESRIRVPVTDVYGLYHPVALLWPDTDVWPDDGEIDYFETSSEAGSANSFSLHHAGSGSPNVMDVSCDNGWHCWAVQWTPTAITAYKDGVAYRKITATAQFPPVAMWHSFQLDWMGEPEPGSPDILMEVDWLRIYTLPA